MYINFNKLFATIMSYNNYCKKDLRNKLLFARQKNYIIQNV